MLTSGGVGWREMCFSFVLIKRQVGLSEILTRKVYWIKDITAALKLVQGYLYMEYTLRSSSKSFWNAFFEKKKKEVKSPQ